MISEITGKNIFRKNPTNNPNHRKWKGPLPNVFFLFPLYSKGWWLFYVETLIQQIVASTLVATHKQICQVIDTWGLANNFGSFFMKIYHLSFNISTKMVAIFLSPAGMSITKLPGGE